MQNPLNDSPSAAALVGDEIVPAQYGWMQEKDAESRMLL